MKQGNTRLARGLVYACAVVDFFALFMLCSGSATAWVFLALVLIGNVAVGCYALSQGFMLELLIERKFQKVCKGLSLTKTSTKANGFEVGAGRYLDPTGRRAEAAAQVAPRLRGLSGTREQWQAQIRPLYGQKIDDYRKHADAFALAFRVNWVGFDLAGNGLIRIRAGAPAIPASFGFEE